MAHPDDAVAGVRAVVEELRHPSCRSSALNCRVDCANELGVVGRPEQLGHARDVLLHRARSVARAHFFLSEDHLHAGRRVRQDDVRRGLSRRGASAALLRLVTLLRLRESQLALVIGRPL